MIWTVQQLETALDNTGLPFAHHGWAKGAKELTADHGIYAENSAAGLWANGQKAESALSGVVDYYTKDDSGDVRTTIEAALTAADCSWYLDLVQLESDGGWLHYVWVWTVAEELPPDPVDPEEPPADPEEPAENSEEQNQDQEAQTEGPGNG